MRVITLSDFTLDQQTIARQTHGSKYRADWDEYKAALRDREERIRSGRSAMWSAARSMRPIRFGKGVVAWLDAWRTSRPDPPTTAPVGYSDAVWGAGRSGELRVREALSDVLDDQWVDAERGCGSKLNRSSPDPRKLGNHEIARRRVEHAAPRARGNDGASPHPGPGSRGMAKPRGQHEGRVSHGMAAAPLDGRPIAEGDTTDLL